MAIVEAAFGMLVKVAGTPIIESAKRRVLVIRALKSVGLDPDTPPSNFEDVYAYALVDYGYGGPKAVLGLLRDEYVREAFREALYENDGERLRQELTNAVDRNRESGGREFGPLPEDVHVELEAFMRAFFRAGRRSQTVPQVLLQRKIEALEQTTVSRLSQRAIKNAGDPDVRFEFDPVKERAAFSSDGWERTLNQIYPSFPLVEFAGKKYPIWEAPSGNPRDLDSWRGELDESCAPDADRYGLAIDRDGTRVVRDYYPEGGVEYEYLVRTTNERSRRNLDAYVLDAMRQDSAGNWVIDARKGNYFESVATAESLEREFISAVSKSPGDGVDLAELPYRNWLHRKQIDDPQSAAERTPLDGRFKGAALSTSTCVILLSAAGPHRALLVPRSAEVQTHPGMLHVAPSGIFAPYNSPWSGWRSDFDIKRNVLREYAEELFNYSELEAAAGVIGSGLPQVPPITRLIETEAKRDGTAQLLYTGISIPLLTLRPEICTALILDADWFDHEIGRAAHIDRRPCELNWEYDPRGTKGLFVELDDDFLPVGAEHLSPASMVPHAAACLSLAARAAREHALS